VIFEIRFEGSVRVSGEERENFKEKGQYFEKHERLGEEIEGG